MWYLLLAFVINLHINELNSKNAMELIEQANMNIKRTEDNSKYIFLFIFPFLLFGNFLLLFCYYVNFTLVSLVLVLKMVWPHTRRLYIFVFFHFQTRVHHNLRLISDNLLRIVWAWSSKNTDLVCKKPMKKSHLFLYMQNYRSFRFKFWDNVFDRVGSFLNTNGEWNVAHKLSSFNNIVLMHFRVTPKSIYLLSILALFFEFSVTIFIWGKFKHDNSFHGETQYAWNHIFKNCSGFRFVIVYYS